MSNVNHPNNQFVDVVTKKPWIPEFFPKRTIVEFDVEDGPSAGVGEVKYIAYSSIDNLIVILDNVELTRGEFDNMFSTNSPDNFSISTSHVTKID